MSGQWRLKRRKDREKYRGGEREIEEEIGMREEDVFPGINNILQLPPTRIYSFDNAVYDSLHSA